MTLPKYSTHIFQLETQGEITNDAHHKKKCQHANDGQIIGTPRHVELFQELVGIAEMAVQLRAREKRSVKTVNG